MQQPLTIGLPINQELDFYAAPICSNVIIASSANDSLGAGTLLFIPFDDLLSLSGTEGGYTIITNTTEGQMTIECYDLAIIGDLKDYCKGADRELIINLYED